MSRVLDLYAGSGALGIEALSRGGGTCDFVERSGPNAALIRENLRLTGLDERARVHRLGAERVTERLRDQRYTLVLADPPYADAAAWPALNTIGASGIVAPGVSFVVEHSSRREPPDALGPLRCAWSRRYGDSQVTIYEE